MEELEKDRAPILPHPWKRLLAFLLDVEIVSVPLQFLLFSIDRDMFTRFFGNYYGIGGSFLILLTSLPVMAICTARFGTTLGKWCMGGHLKSSSGSPLSFLRCYQRQAISFIMGAGLLVITEITALFMFMSYRRLKVTGFTAWDSTFFTKAEFEHSAPWKKVILATILATLYVGNRVMVCLTIYRPLLEEYWKMLQELQTL
jgi:uncharacterized RDD family membrane protein YckC